MQHYSKGIDFTGAIVKPGRIYPLNRTVTSFKYSIQRLNECRTIKETVSALSSVNSYLGLLRHYDSYAIRYSILNDITPELFKYVYIKGHMETVALKKKYHPKTKLNKRVRAGTLGMPRLPAPIALFEEREDKMKYLKMLSECTLIQIPS